MPEDSADDGSLVIGIDGGASGLRAYTIDRLPTGRLTLSRRSIQGQWEHVPEFRPQPLDEQLAQLEAGAPVIGSAEQRAADSQVDMLSSAIEELSASMDRAELVVGLCMPGLSDAQGEGVLVSRHGPRSPHLRERLSEDLVQRGLVLERPLPGIASDGQAAGWGEEVAPLGLFGGVDRAYYLGAGTGVAEALKFGGQHWDMAALREDMPAPWALPGANGRTLEDCISMAGLARERQRLGGATDSPVLTDAHEGHSLSRELLEQSAVHTGRLLVRRLQQLWDWDRAGLDRIVLGQRSGQALADEGLEDCYAVPLRRTLQEGVLGLENAELREMYLDGGRLLPDLLQASTLGGVAALGAAALALGLWPASLPA